MDTPDHKAGRSRTPTNPNPELKINFTTRNDQSNPRGSDVVHYFEELQRASISQIDSALPEYPVPVTWLLGLPYTFSSSTVQYVSFFVMFMLMIDAAFTTYLCMQPREVQNRAVFYWLAFAPIIGPIIYLRFDLIPSVLAAAAILAAKRHPWSTGALAALGAAIKLWPAVVLAALMSQRLGRWRKAGGFLIAGIGLIGISLLVGGWQRLVSPLTWQADRGLQIESFWATPLLVLRLVFPERWRTEVVYGADEIFGPGRDVLISASNYTAILAILMLIVLWVRSIQASSSSGLLAPSLFVITAIMAMLVVNKTFSPQYVIWLGAPGDGACHSLAARSPYGEDSRGYTPARAADPLGLSNPVLRAILLEPFRWHDCCYKRSPNPKCACAIDRRCRVLARVDGVKTRRMISSPYRV